jgi:hypothetical protein
MKVRASTYVVTENGLILGIATSAVDLDTDKAIQEIIHGPAFSNVTMFTIAYVIIQSTKYSLIYGPATD